MAQFQFDANTVAPDAGVVDPLPAGWYNMVVDETSIEPTSKGDGAYIKAKLKVISGHYSGRVVFTNFNIRNANPTAQEIAYKQLSALCHATGQLTFNDTSELHQKPLKVRVSVRAGDGTYEPSNDVKAYRNINETIETNETQKALVIPPPKAAAGATPGFGAPAAAPGGFPQFGSAPAPAAPAGGFPSFGGAAPAQAAPQFGQAPAAAPAPQAAPPVQPQAAPQFAQQPQPQAAPQQFQQPPAPQFQQPAQQAPVQQPVQTAPAQAPAAAPAQPFAPGVPTWAQQPQQ